MRTFAHSSTGFTTQDGYGHRATLIILRNQAVRARLGKRSKTVGAAYVQAGRVPAHCTLGLCDGVANDPQVAFPAVPPALLPERLLPLR